MYNETINAPLYDFTDHPSGLIGLDSNSLTL